MPNLFLLPVALILGLCFGSFCNVLIFRDDRRLSIMTGRSACLHCRHELRWYELFPVLSFIFLRARCFKCKKPISWQYPLVELVAAGLAVFSFWIGERSGYQIWQIVCLASILLIFLVISVIDIRTMYVPVEYCLIAGFLGIILKLSSHSLISITLAEGIVGGAGTIMAVILLWRLFFHQEGMGVGDAWIAGAMGAVLGFPYIFAALIAAVFSGSIIGIAMLPGSKKKLQTAIPFGPFLFLGLIVTLGWGQDIAQWYTLYIWR